MHLGLFQALFTYRECDVPEICTHNCTSDKRVGGHIFRPKGGSPTNSDLLQTILQTQKMLIFDKKKCWYLAMGAEYSSETKYSVSAEVDKIPVLVDD
jgi:hypothetical protein